MSIQELLEQAFLAGKLFQLDQYVDCSGNNPDFEEWLELNQYEIDSTISDIKDVSFQNGIDAGIYSCSQL
jgi:hypothetical protein